jgi:ASC-1-like (ASCH) protein
MRRMGVKQGVFSQIKAGAESLEVRIGYDNIKSILVGERIAW